MTSRQGWSGLALARLGAEGHGKTGTLQGG